MPNIIKSNCVLITDNDVKVIDSNYKDDFSPMSMKKVVELNSEENGSEEKLSNEEELFQINHMENTSEKLHEMQAYAETIIEDAKKEADEIKQNTLLLAQKEIDQLREQSKQEGFEQGMVQAQSEIENQKQLLSVREQELEEEFNQKVIAMQSQVTELLVSLIQKLTGVIIEEKSIITYLVCDAVKGQSACNEFRISVSKADYPQLNEDIEQIKDQVRSTAQITIIENPELAKNQCKIETEKSIIDCGIETKLDNLLMALKLLM